MFRRALLGSAVVAAVFGMESTPAIDEFFQELKSSDQRKVSLWFPKVCDKLTLEFADSSVEVPFGDLKAVEDRLGENGFSLEQILDEESVVKTTWLKVSRASTWKPSPPLVTDESTTTASAIDEFFQELESHSDQGTLSTRIPHYRTRETGFTAEFMGTKLEVPIDHCASFIIRLKEQWFFQDQTKITWRKKKKPLASKVSWGKALGSGASAIDEFFKKLKTHSDQERFSTSYPYFNHAAGFTAEFMGSSWDFPISDGRDFRIRLGELKEEGFFQEQVEVTWRKHNPEEFFKKLENHSDEKSVFTSYPYHKQDNGCTAQFMDTKLRIPIRQFTDFMSRVQEHGFSPDHERVTWEKKNPVVAPGSGPQGAMEKASAIDEFFKELENHSDQKRFYTLFPYHNQEAGFTVEFMGSIWEFPISDGDDFRLRLEGLGDKGFSREQVQVMWRKI